MHADRVLEGEGLAAAVAEVGVEVADQAEAVAAEDQAVGAHPHAVLADVERVLPPLRRPGVAVGDDHLGERRPVQHGPVAAPVAVAEVVQGQPLAGVEPDHEGPVLPADVVTLDLEARPLGLADLQRLEAVADVFDARRGIVPRPGRERPLAIFLDPDDLHRVEVDHRPEPLDRADVAVVGRVGPDEAEGPGEASGRVLGRPVVPRAPDVDHHERRVVDPGVRLELRQELGAPQDGPLALDLLVDRHRRLDAGDVLPAQEGVAVERERGLVTGVRRVVKEHGERLARRPFAVLGRPVDPGLVGLQERDGDEPRRRRDLPLRFQERHGRADLRGVEGFERVLLADRGAGVRADVDELGHVHLLMTGPARPRFPTILSDPAPGARPLSLTPHSRASSPSTPVSRSCPARRDGLWSSGNPSQRGRTVGPGRRAAPDARSPDRPGPVDLPRAIDSSRFNRTSPVMVSY